MTALARAWALIALGEWRSGYSTIRFAKGQFAHGQFTQKNKIEKTYPNLT